MLLKNLEEVRVLGSLIEKEYTTPDYYPMTVNGLTAACNQKNNRNPVVNYSEKTVNDLLEQLRERALASRITGSESRVPRYGELLTTKLGLNLQEIAVLNVLMLRGPQTVGEIKGRGERIYKFNDLSETDEVIQKLCSSEEPLIIKLPRQPGKDVRYMHLLTEFVLQQEEPEEPEISIEEKFEQLRAEFLELKEEFTKFRKQFE